jgi:hypothetical protein
MGAYGSRYIGRSGSVYGARGSVYAGRGVYRGSRVYGNPYYSSAVRNSTVHRSGQHYQSSASHMNHAADVNHARSFHPTEGVRSDRNQHRTNAASATAHSASEAQGSAAQSAGRKQDLATTGMRHHARNGGSSQLQDSRHQQSRLDPQTSARLRNYQGRKPSYAEAKRFNHTHDGDHHHNGDHHHDGHHGHHDHDWWHHHCPVIIWADWGWWGWYDGWWYPAWGYAPYSYYAYDDPIYCYDGLPPDQIIGNVQSALQEQGYYNDAADGVMGPRTRAALATFQRDHGLAITSAIDQPTLRALGFGG